VLHCSKQAIELIYVTISLVCNNYVYENTFQTYFCIILLLDAIVSGSAGCNKHSEIPFKRIKVSYFQIVLSDSCFLGYTVYVIFN